MKATKIFVMQDSSAVDNDQEQICEGCVNGQAVSEVKLRRSEDHFNASNCSQ